MKNAKWAAGAVIIIVIVAAVLFTIFHNSSSPSTNNSTASTARTNKSSGSQSSIIMTKTDPKLGEYLTDASGRALYTYNADSANTSNCTGSCLATWPAYTAASSMANLPSGVGTITRTDNNEVQYTYNGMPLYYFVSDKDGQVTGNGVENFQIAKPAAATQQSNMPSNQSNSNSSSGGYNY